MRVEQVIPAPAGKGAASAWVRRNYATHVKKRRSKSFQTNLGLLIVVDGDNVGVAARLQELAHELEQARIEPRGPEESIALFVPTWSIETWLAHLSGAEGVDEATPSKVDDRFRVLWSDGKAESRTIEQAVAAWNGSIEPLPSLCAAYLEAPRVGLPPK